MKKSVRDLLALQSVDLRIRNLEIRYKTIPIERANLVEEFETARKKYNLALEAVKNAEKEVRVCQSENASEQENLKNSKIRSATIKKAAEYDAIMTQISGCEKRISDLETREIELYDVLEKVKGEAAKAERSYKATGRLAQNEVRELDALKVKILSEIKEKSQLSKLMEKDVAASILAQYKRMLASGKGEPLGRISSDMCPNCSLKLPPMTLNEASKGNLVECDHCSYLLYDPEPKAE